MLVQWKSRNGPVSNIDEIEHILKREKMDKIEPFVKTEIPYYRSTHKSDVTTTHHYKMKVNKVTQEWLTNLCVLLGVLINWLITVVLRNKNALAALHNVPKVVEEENLLFLEIKPNLYLDRKKWQ